MDFKSEVGFSKVKLVCEENGGQPDFVFAHCDCEMAIINAIRSVFPNSQPRLCRFHITDAIRKWFNNIGGRAILKTNSDLRQFYTRLRQIFFFPIDLWPRLWKLMLRDLSSETRSETQIWLAGPQIWLAVPQIWLTGS